jgi:hypothetical protein
MGMSQWALLVGALALAGCGRGGDRAESTRDTGGMMGRMDSGGMGMGHMDSSGMKMGGMPMQGMQMMSNMRAHMDSMMRMPPEQMSRMMVMHERMMSQIMDRKGSEMRDMKKAADPRWNALSDSVKRDLAELPGLKGQKLQAKMRAHEERVRRLMEMHESMMKDM